MSKNNLWRKFLLSVIFLLSILIVMVYVWGVYLPERNSNTPVRESQEIRDK